jgi:hypothetical protein
MSNAKAEINAKERRTKHETKHTTKAKENKESTMITAFTRFMHGLVYKSKKSDIANFFFGFRMFALLVYSFGIIR